MSHIYVRTINIDIIPQDPNPFITMNLEKVVTDAEGNPIQTIGNFGRIVKRLSDIGPIPVGTIADDDLVDAGELFYLIAAHTMIWIQEAYGGEVGDSVVVVD
ncbi:MAG: hypothetical protein DRR06_12835 [Gammaproteobacteria bacterium]|nr:MAG: hypothetical protein DRR06_12835 [Gammaproteobacteria bacterium]